jgi:hypothetical protein
MTRNKKGLEPEIEQQEAINDADDLIETQPEAPAILEENQSPEPEIDWSKIKRINHNSLEGRWRLERWSIIRELWRAHHQRVIYYMKPEGGDHSLEEAIKMANVKLGEGPTLEKEMERISSWNVDSISWYSLDRVFRSNPSYAQQVWEDVKEQALNDFKSGHFAAEMFERTAWQKDVWKRAHFIVIYEEMIEAYKPQDAIEHSMVEMVAVNFFMWRHWVQEHMQRATTEPRRESYDYQQWAKSRGDVSRYYDGERHSRKRQSHWTDGYWDIPYQSEAEAIEHALEMADRCRRAYQASVRALRDWRRYNVPVTINNPQQVNIAAEGGQQVNVQNKSKRIKKKEPASPAAQKKRPLKCLR